MLTDLRVAAGPVALARVFLAAGAILASVEAAALAVRLQGGAITTPAMADLPDLSPTVVLTWFALMTVASAGLLVGVLPRAAAGTLAVGHAVVLLVDQQLYSNHRVLLVLLCAWFVFARSDRSWAPGARRRRRGAGSTVPWWPGLLVVATVSSCYLFAGLSKLNPAFLSGETVAPLTPAWFPADAATWATPAVEVTIATCLWFRRTRWVAIGLGLGLHLSIVVLMGAPLVFGGFALLCLTAYPLAGSRPTYAGDAADRHGSAGGDDPAVEHVTGRA